MRSDFPPVIGICGLKGSGKSYSANHFEKKHGYQVIKFAAPIKDMLRAIGLNNDDLEGSLKEAEKSLLCGHTPRWAMQSLGTEWGRKCIDENFWVSLWERKVERSLEIGLPVVVDDLRFKNEAEAVRSMNGLILQIKRDGARFDGHQSEVIDFEVDLEVINDGEIRGVLDHCLEIWSGAQS